MSLKVKSKNSKLQLIREISHFSYTFYFCFLSFAFFLLYFIYIRILLCNIPSKSLGCLETAHAHLPKPPCVLSARTHSSRKSSLTLFWSSSFPFVSRIKFLCFLCSFYHMHNSYFIFISHIEPRLFFLLLV